MANDEIWKVFFSDAARYADLINGLGFSGRQVVKPQDVKERDGQVVFFRSGFLRKARKRLLGASGTYTRDMVRKVIFGTGFAVVGLENQETVDYSIPLRILLYDAGEYERQATEIRRMVRNLMRKESGGGSLSAGEFLYRFRRQDKLKPVITLLLYCGQEEWKGPQSLRDMIDFQGIPPELRAAVPDYPIHLVEIRKLENTDVFQTDIKQVFDFIRCAQDGERLKQLVEEEERYGKMAEDAFDVAVTYTKSVELVGQKEEYRGEEGINMCKAIQDLVESSRHEGMEQGIERGIEQGIERGREQTSIQYNKLILYLNRQGRIQEVVRVAEDAEYREALLREMDAVSGTNVF